jgi:hypothetical protein
MACSALLIKIDAQSYRGQVFCINNATPVSYANIGVVGKNIGTVSDEDGRFLLPLDI